MEKEIFFKNTGVKTSVLYFENTGPTEEVGFIQINKVNDVIEEIPLQTVNIDKIIENEYSLNMNLYREIILDVNDDFEVVELDQLIVKFESGTYVDDISGTLYPYYNSNGVTGQLDTYTLEGNYIIQASSGNLNNNIFYYSGRLNHTNFTIAYTTNETCLTKYLYYYIKLNIDLLENYSNQSTIPNLDKNSFKKCKIILPPLEVQNRIVEQLDNIYETEILSSKQVIDSLKMSIETIMKNTMYRDDLQEYKIKDIVNFTRSRLASGKIEHVEDGLYPVISISEKSKKINEYEYNDESIYIASTSSGTSSGPYKTKIKYYNGRCKFTSMMLKMNVINNNISCKYLHKYLNMIIKYIELNCEKGACNKSLNREVFDVIKLRIPPIEVQREILRKIEPKEQLIQDLQNNINRAEIEAKDIMSVLFN